MFRKIERDLFLVIFLKRICIWRFSEFALASHHMIDFTLRMHCPDEIKGLPVFQTLGRSFQPCAAWTDLLGGAGDPCACSEVRIALPEQSCTEYL